MISRGILTLTSIHEAETQGALPLGSQSFTIHSPLCPLEGWVSEALHKSPGKLSRRLTPAGGAASLTLT